jgi:hypothetical protein
LRADLRITLALAAIPLIAGVVAIASGRRAHAEDGEVDRAEAAERCAVRLSIAIAGKSPDAALLASADPQAAVDALVASPELADRFASFVNAEFNGGPSAGPTDDPVYYLAKHIVVMKRPWSDMFAGGYAIVPTATGMEVRDDASGLGYFRSPTWMKRYAGNEPGGAMLVATFRILQNTTGLELVPSVGDPGDDRTAAGRMSSPCKSCHVDAWYALDTFSKLLPKRNGMGDTMTFTPPAAGPQTGLGKTLANDADFVRTLVDSDAFRFAQCRNVFKFLYGRAENQCEAAVFDKCVDALSRDKTIQAAVSAVAKDPSFCK